MENSYSFVVISPEKEGLSDKDNEDRMIYLKARLMENKIRYYPAIGITRQWGKENSLVIFGMPKWLAHYLCEKLDQVCILTNEGLIDQQINNIAKMINYRVERVRGELENVALPEGIEAATFFKAKRKYLTMLVANLEMGEEGE